MGSWLRRAPVYRALEAARHESDLVASIEAASDLGVLQRRLRRVPAVHAVSRRLE